MNIPEHLPHPGHGAELYADRIREALDTEDWEDSYCGEGQVRRVYLGTVFGLMPSGKFYMPFACSNVMGCATCGGTGTLPLHARRRVTKKMVSRHAAIIRKFDRLVGSDCGSPGLLAAFRVDRSRRAACRYIDRFPKRYRSRAFYGASCTACGGTGSREAHLDELWREYAESVCESVGACLASGEGDPCDMFVEEYRDTPDAEDAEDAESEAS